MNPADPPPDAVLPVRAFVRARVCTRTPMRVCVSTIPYAVHMQHTCMQHTSNIHVPWQKTRMQHTCMYPRIIRAT